MKDKVNYVRRQSQNRRHECHWPTCVHQVPPAMWGCREHWFNLPKALRDRIWEAYQPGQEINLTPSDEYMKVVLEVQKWIADYESSSSH